MAEFKTQGGAVVKVFPAPFGDAMALKNAIVSELAKTELKGLISAKSTDIVDVGQLIAAAFQVDSSPEFQRALFTCLVRCTYNGEKITENTFEAVEAREAYYDILTECVKENVLPFFRGLASKLNGLGLTTSSVVQK